ncbi:MAG: gliding motility-associated C-terminal domain-containing protein, partial [Bacteroidales bacterium]
EFEVGQGVDYKQIQFTVENAQKVQIQKRNNLRIVQKLGEINEKGAISYALEGIKSYSTRYIKRKGVYSFSLQGRKSEAVRIDPVLEWASYLVELSGKKSQLTDVCVDEKTGGLYVCGWSEGAAFPYKEQEGASNWEFEQVKKRNTNSVFMYLDSNKHIQWCTFFGVDEFSERAQVISLSPQKHLLCAGILNGSSLTTAPYTLNKEGAYQGQSCQGINEIQFPRTFILEFDANNRIEWAALWGVLDSYVRDSSIRYALPLDMVITAKDELYCSLTKLTGFESLTKYPKENDQTYMNQTKEGTILKFDKNRAWVWGTNYGTDKISAYGISRSTLSRIASDSANNIWVAGNCSDHIPILKKTNAYNQEWHTADTSQLSGVTKGDLDFSFNTEGILWGDNRGNQDLFLSKFNPQGILLWSTAIGGKWEDELTDMKIAPNGHLFVIGFTRSKDFPIKEKKDAFNRYYTSGRNAFLMEFSNEGALLWSTHLPKQDSLFTTSAIAEVLSFTPNNGIYIIGSGPIQDYKIDPRVHTEQGIYEISQELGLSIDETYSYIHSIVDTTNSLSFLLYFSPQGKLLLWDSLPFYGNAVAKSDLYTFDVLSGFPIPKNQCLTTDLYRGKLWSLLSRWGNTALVNPKDGSYFAPNTKPYPQVSSLLLRYTNCFKTFFPARLGNGDTLYCAQHLLTLQKPKHFYEYQSVWSTGATTDSLLITKPGTYWLSLHSPYPHCPNLYSDTLHIDSIPYPTLHFSNDTNYLCVGEKLYLNATQLKANYLWYTGSQDSSHIVEYLGDSMIQAWCRVNTICGDTVFDTAFVRYAPPYIYLGSDTVLCHTDTLPLDASKYNGNIPCLYTWFINGDSVSSSPFYTLTRIKDTFLICVRVSLRDQSSSCIAWDTLHVRYYTYPDVSLHLSDTSFCVGTTLSLDARSHTSMNTDAHFSWYTISDSLYCSNAIAFFSDTGVFRIKAKNYCSQAYDTIHIDYVPTVWTQITLPEDTNLCMPNSCTVDVSTAYPQTHYLWNDGEELSLRTFTSSGSYTLTLWDTMGCSQSQDFRVQIEECAIEVDLPNVFTPNGDGINDCFVIRNVDQLQNFTIHIFNSWGLSVYKYQGDPKCMTWNGRLYNNGAFVPDGAYFWIVTCKDLLGKAQKQTGCVMILR